MTPGDLNALASPAGGAGPGLEAGLMSTLALGQMRVRRPGCGARPLAGPDAFGPPPDRAPAIGVLQAAVTARADHLDTAQYHGPGAVNGLIGDAFHPCPGGLAIVSKAAVRRDAEGAVPPFEDPGQLRPDIEGNLRSLRATQLAAAHLRLPGDGRAGAHLDDQLAAMVAAREAGLIARAGLSNASLEQLRHAAGGTDTVCAKPVPPRRPPRGSASCRVPQPRHRVRD
jgi:pyridoxine 4-dehydrogenase